MKSALLSRLLDYLLKNLTPEMIRRCADAVLDVVENGIADTKTKTDDAILLPICKMIRELFRIPDEA